MTVGELIEALGDYGDHVNVAVRLVRGEHEYTTRDLNVDYGNVYEGEDVESCVLLEADAS